jgi:N-methylhydantoinase A
MVLDTSTGVMSAWAVLDRAAMAVGAGISGPAIIAEDETSTLVSPGWRAFVNGLGYIEITQESA